MHIGEHITEIYKKQEKRKIQLSFENIVITAQPPTGRCKPKDALKEPKEIIKGVSGTIMPGQFLAIIGASGKLNRLCLNNHNS